MWGAVVRNGTLWRKVGATTLAYHYKRLHKRAGLPPFRFHDHRHSCASSLLAKGVPPEVIQGILGQSQISTTINIYAHVMPTLKQETADAMDASSAASRTQGLPGRLELGGSRSEKSRPRAIRLNDSYYVLEMRVNGRQQIVRGFAFQLTVPFGRVDGRQPHPDSSTCRIRHEKAEGPRILMMRDLVIAKIRNVLLERASTLMEFWRPDDLVLATKLFPSFDEVIVRVQRGSPDLTEVELKKPRSFIHQDLGEDVETFYLKPEGHSQNRDSA